MTGTHAPLLRPDLYEVAYLAGGPRRVVETAVVALVENGRLRVDRATGRLHVVDLQGRHPVEAVVLDAVGPRGRSVWGLVWRARSPVASSTAASTGCPRRASTVCSSPVARVTRRRPSSIRATTAASTARRGPPAR